MYTIDENKRRYLRNKIIIGAKKYSDNLIGNIFLVLCEDGISYEVKFLVKDFIHLTGILSNLSDVRFFENSKNNLLEVGNILCTQKYNWSTLKGKADRIENIDRLLYGTSEDSIFMVNLHTHTGDFPTAIRNRNINICVGFKDADNRARTLRKYSNSQDADEQKIIVAVLKRKADQKVYNEVVYLKGVDALGVIKFISKETLSNEIMRLLFYEEKNKSMSSKRIFHCSINKKVIPICFNANTYSEKLKRIKLKNRMK